MLKVNKQFAKRYDQYRRKEEIQKLKDKLGNGKVSELKAAAADAEQSSSESEDSDAEAWTPELEKGFLRVYAALRTGDSRIYDPNVKWFNSDEDDGDDGDAGENEKQANLKGKDSANNGEEEEEEKGEKYKPMYFNEYHRNYLLQGAYENDDEVTEKAHTQQQVDDDDDDSHKLMLHAAADAEEMERIKSSIKHGKKSRIAASADTDEGEEEEEEDEFLVKRDAAAAAAEDQEEQAMQQLHAFLSNADDEGSGLDDECKKDLTKLKQVWNADDQLTEDERYLRDYITKQYWRKPPSVSVPHYTELVGSEEEEEEQEGSLSADEEFLTRQKEFEEKWNNRTDEPDEEFAQKFQRTFSSADKLIGEAGADDDDDDDELFVAKEPGTGAADKLEEEEEELPADVLEELRRIESQRQWTLDSELLDDGGNAVDADGKQEEDTAVTVGDVSVKTYPRAVPDSLRQSEGNARTRARAERRERVRAEKSAKRSEIEQLVRMREEELQRKLLRLQRNAGTDAINRQLDDDFMEADFDPEEHDRRMAAIFDQEFYGEGEAKPDFSDEEDDNPNLEAPDADEGVQASGKKVKKKQQCEQEIEELRHQLAAAEQQQAEDFIRGGPGESQLSCRFNYRQVEPNDFGLDPVEILLADDRELNAWVSVRKMSQYRQREAELRDKRRYRTARQQMKKQQLMPTMLQRLAEAESQQQQPELIRTGSNDADTADDSTAKKRRRRKKKKNTRQSNPEETESVGCPGEADAASDGAAAPAGVDAVDDQRSRQSRKRHRKSDSHEGVEQQANAEEAASTSASEAPAKKKVKKVKGKNRLQISESRLRDLGIDPKKFRRLQRIRNSASADQA